MQNFFCLGLVSVLWAVVVYSLAFGGTSRWIGNLDFVWLGHFHTAPPGLGLTIPPSLFMAYQMMFAVITPALITGAIADRMRFGAWVWFLGLWVVLVYAPVAHWVFAPSGWLGATGRARLRGRHGGARQRRDRRARGGARAREATGLAAHADATPLAAAHVARNGHLVVRMVRLQRRLRARRQRARRTSPRQHATRGRRGRCSAGCSSNGCTAGTRRRWVPRRARSRAWSRLRLAPVSSAGCHRSRSGLSPG